MQFHSDCDRIDDWLPVCLPGYLYLIMSKSIDKADHLIIKVSCNGLAIDGVSFSDILISNTGLDERKPDFVAHETIKAQTSWLTISPRLSVVF